MLVFLRSVAVRSTYRFKKDLTLPVRNFNTFQSRKFNQLTVEIRNSTTRSLRLIPLINRLVARFITSAQINVAERQTKMPEKVVQPQTPKFERLPKIAKPNNYKLFLKLNLNKFTFEGDVEIDLEVLRATDHVVLNSHDLNVNAATLVSKVGGETLNCTSNLDPKQERVTFKLPKEVLPGQAKLKIKYDGMLNDKMKGLYRSKYKNDKGEEHYVATTQFESTFARWAFPCFDEPVYKATYDISLTIPKGKTALSNMNEISETDEGNGWKTLRFATTPVMSSYLVAFCVGDFEFVEGYTPTDNVRVRVYTLPGKKYQGEYALEVSLKAIPFFSKFFGIPYGLPKCDLIAIPDFNFGAMENWGLVTYREVFLLLDPARSTSLGKENIALVVAHELAHMWFGNLTTMEWWTDLWLKEGYATWMEYYFCGENYPEFDIFSQFLTAETLRALSLDALKNSHPVEVPIENPNDVENIYDAVSYSKSASLIRMLHDFVGDEKFRDGLQNYLKKYSYKNTVTENLWDCLSEASGRNIRELMSVWTKQMGYPLIKVKTTYENNKTVLHMSQERFMADGSKDATNTLWQVPITVATSAKDSKAQKFLLTKQTDTFELDGVCASDWIKLNAGFCGFYKVQYSDDMLQKLLKPLADKALQKHDRLNICGDLFSLVQSGRASAVDYLRVLSQSSNETEYSVWSELDSGVEVLDNCIRRTDYRAHFDSFCRSAYEPIAKKLDWEPKPKEGHTVGMLRPVVLRRLGACGDKEVIATARKLFRAFVDHGTDMTPDLRSMVFGLVAKNDGAKAQDEIIKIFEKSDFSEVQRHCLVAIGRSDDIDLQKKALEYAFDSKKVRLQDAYLVMAGISTSTSGQATLWNYFMNNMHKLLEMYGSANSGLFMACIKMSVRYHCTEEMYKEIEAFFDEHKDLLAPANLSIQQSLENVRLNIDLLRRNSEVMKTFFVKA